jgi:hypothetical protein
VSDDCEDQFAFLFSGHLLAPLLMKLFLRETISHVNKENAKKCKFCVFFCKVLFSLCPWLLGRLAARCRPPILMAGSQVFF